MLLASINSIGYFDSSSTIANVMMSFRLVRQQFVISINYVFQVTSNAIQLLAFPLLIAVVIVPNICTCWFTTFIFNKRVGCSTMLSCKVLLNLI